LNYALLCAECRVVNNLAIILEDISVHDLDNFHILSYDSRVGAPEWKIVTYYTYSQVDPKNPTYGLMFWVQRVITQSFLLSCSFYA
jgi:hypothetical protein